MMQWKTGGVVLMSWVVGLQTFTQVLAYRAHYARALGPGLWQAEAFYQRHSLYWPWQGLQWTWRWGTQAPDAVRLAALIALIPLGLGLAVAMLGQGARRRTNPPPMEGHGTTQWARRGDVKEAGLL
jgi:hypothetical protein